LFPAIADATAHPRAATVTFTRGSIGEQIVIVAADIIIFA
jgi:hypothetical protein